MKKVSLIVLSFVLVITAFPVSALANVQYFSGVTKEMCTASYWADKSKYADEVILTPDEIAEYNAAGVAASGTSLADLEKINPIYNADDRKTKVISSIEADFFNEDKTALTTAHKFFVDGIQVDKSYFDAFIAAIEETGFTGTQREVLYGICTKQANVMNIPSDDIVGYSATDADSETQISELKVGDPCIIRQKCDIKDGSDNIIDTFYHVGFDHLSGWVNAKNLAICADREEWLDAWKYDINSKDILVITCDKVVTEKSLKVPLTSEVKLTMGTVLKLVPEDEIPRNIGERNSWNNYTVWLPARAEDGSYIKQAALISEHYNVSVGFPEFTERNIAKIAFSCLGNRYGWSGMLDAMDCSLYTRDVYRCFGFKIPRNTTFQLNVPNTKIDIDGKTDEEKQAIIEKMPVGALLYFSGHTMIYLGSENGTGYVISELGSTSEPEGEIDVKSSYSVVVNPLTARRGVSKGGYPWIRYLHSIIIPAHYAEHKEATDKAVAPTCTKAGLTAGTHCRACKQVLTAQKTVPATGHKTAAIAAVPATFKKAGKTAGAKCTVCGKVVTPQKTAPKLVSPKLSKVTADDNGFTAKWKKSSGVDGYQIRYSLKKNMKGSKTVTAGKNAVSKKVKKLKSRKTYYIKIRAYKTVNGKKLFGKWSNKKTVKTL
ncbi:MAG: C40 family peptidase [Eubacterium sp.]|nr:C40 family peptidase [Eubacterium sp.]